MGFLSVLRGLSVVLPVIISTMALMMLSGALNNFVVQKSCSPAQVPDNINEFICPNTTVVDYANEILSTATGIKYACAAVFTSAFGFLRDMAGKSKFLMYVGIFAELITVSCYFASSMYWNTSAWIPALTQAFVSGCFGETVMQLGATCILMQDSTPEELPFRMQLFMTSTLLLILIGGTLTTMILTTFGYRWLFTVCIGLHVVSLLLVVILVKEKGFPSKSLEQSLGGLKTVFRWRENVSVLWLMLVAGPLTTAVFSNEGIDAAQFFQLKLRFSMYQSAVFGTYGFIIALVGSIVGPLILRKVFHSTHLTIGIVASVLNIVATAASAFVETTLSLYFLAWLSFLRLATLPLPNTVISTIVNRDELGTYLGIAAIFTAGIPFGVARAYRAVFSATKDDWIGAFFFVSSAFFALLALIYSISYCLYVEPKKPEVTESKEDLDQNIETEKSDLPEDTTKI